MRSAGLRIVAIVVALWGSSALASHFRYGTIHWRIPNPSTAPRTVEFTVTVAWRSTFVDSTNLDFGNGTSNGLVTGTTIGTGTDTLGNAYTINQYTATHTYAGALTQFTAFFANCCRVAGLVNGANGNFRVETVVQLTPGNTAGPVSGSPAIIQLQFGAVRTYAFPIVDADGDPTSCRFATPAESGLLAAEVIPSVPNGGAQPTLSSSPGQCLVTWDLTNALAGQLYVLHVVLQSTNSGVVSNSALDLIVEIVTPPPPVCTGSISQFLQVGTPFSRVVTGTHTLAGNLTLVAAGVPVGATMTPASGTNGPSPYSSTFNFTPAAIDLGRTYVVTTQFRNFTNASGTCVLELTVLLPPPTITSPLSGSAINSATPLVSGTAPAGATVRVNIDGASACTAVASVGGLWSCTAGTAQTNGSHSITAVVVPAVGAPSAPATSIVFVDTVAPDTAITAQPPAQSSSTSATFAFTGSDAAPSSGIASFVCTLDGVPAACTSPRTYAGLSQGPHTFTVRAVDGAGNTDATPASVTWTVDSVAPAAPAVSAPTAGANLASGTLPLSGTAEPGSTVTVREGAIVLCVATADAGTGAWTCTPPSTLGDGSHTVSVTATDAAGNVSAPTGRTFAVDTVAPDTAITAQPPAQSSSTSATFAFTGSDAAPSSGIASFVCTLDGVPASCTSPQSYSGLSQGPHTFTVAAVDGAGNTDATAASVTWTVDTVAPAAPAISAPTAGANLASGTVPLSGTAEPGSTVTVREGAIVLCVATADAGTGAWTCTPPSTLGDGSHALSVTATDPAGNESAITSLTVTVDTVVPDTALTAQPPALSNSATATFDFTGTDAAPSSGIVSFVCTLDGVPASCTGPQSYLGLSEGPHTFTVAAVDAAGNTDATPASFTWTVDTLAPAAPVLTSPAFGTAIASTTPPLSGTGTPGDTVTVSSGATTLCTALVDSQGAWTCTPGTPLMEGGTTLTLVATDPAGNVSAPGTAVVTVDTTAPLAPVITAPSDGSTLGGPAVTLAGTAEAGATVTVTVDGNVVGTAIADASGGWTFDATLPAGAHTARATAADRAGNVSPASSPVSFTTVSIDTSIDSGPPALTSSTSATFDFSANVAGVAFECSLDGAAYAACSDPVTFANLAEGAHTLGVRAVDARGNADGSPATATWTVDSLAPPAPLISSPAAGSIVGFARPPIVGSAEPLSTLTVIIDGVIAGTTTADAGGQWTFTPTADLANGAHTVSASAADAAGNTGSASAPVAFTVDTSALDTLIVSGPSGATQSASATFDFDSNQANVTYQCSLDGAPFVACADPVTFSTLADGTHTLSVRAVNPMGVVDATPATRTWTVDATPPPAPVISSPADGATIATTTPTVTGTAEPGALVEVTVDGLVVGTATADASGQWVLPLTTALAAGSHTASATATDAAGNQSAPSATTTFTVDPSALDTFILSGPPLIVSSTAATFDFDSSASPVTYECSLDGGPFTACSDPATFTSLADGAHVLEVRARDATRTDGSPAIWRWTIDTTAPAAPAIVAPADGSTVLTPTPVVRGTAEAGAVVTVTVDGVVVGTTTAAADGTWVFPLVNALADGAHTVTATATDAAGNVSPASATTRFTVGTAALTAPSITSPTNGTVTNDPTPTITGTGTPGSTVTVFVDGVAVGATTVDSTGAWSLTPASPLSEGPHTVTASASDALGQMSSASAPVVVTVDSVAPDTIIDRVPPAASPSDRAQVEFSASEPGSTFECSLDGAPFAPCTSPQGFEGLGLGDHLLLVRATDAAGNTDATPARVEWRVTDLSYLGGGVSCSSTGDAAWPLALVVGLLALARRRRAGMVAAAVFLAGPALAQTTAAPPFEVETLQLNTSGQHGLIVNTGVILPRGGWRASLTMHLQHDPLVVRVDGQRVGAAVGDRLTAHLVGAWAPLDWLEIGAQLPLVVFQRGDDLSSHGLTTPAVAALGTPWLDVRGVVLKQSKGAPLDLGGRVSLGLPLGSDAALTRDSTVRAEFSVSAGRTLLPWLRAGAEVGFGLRPGTVLSPTPTLADEVGSGFRLSAGVNTVGGKLRGEAALRALLPTSRAPAGGELLLGARYSLLEQLEVYAVAGPGFGLAPGTPAFRVLLGVAYQGGATAAGPCEAGQKHTPQQCPALDDDGDGVLNAVDACPLSVGSGATKGCPDTDADGLGDGDDQCPKVAGTAAFKGCPDSDGDGLADGEDLCPKVAGTAAFRGCPDSDGDGIADGEDKCPQVAGAAALQGCPDSDGDGLADGDDRCPQVAGTAAFFGCPDGDGDGLPDAEDDCPSVAGSAALKGCPDGDGDGVADRDDTCPKVAGTTENNGCPAKQRQLVVISRDQILILDKVYFATGRSTILARSFPLLDRVAAVLAEHPEISQITVEGHTDNAGSAPVNRKLSEARADAVASYLKKKGVGAERLQARGYGPDQPSAPNTTPEGREANRRVEFKVTAHQ